MCFYVYVRSWKICDCCGTEVRLFEDVLGKNTIFGECKMEIPSDRFIPTTMSLTHTDIGPDRKVA